MPRAQKWDKDRAEFCAARDLHHALKPYYSDKVLAGVLPGRKEELSARKGRKRKRREAEATGSVRIVGENSTPKQKPEKTIIPRRKKGDPK
ncbi:MAG TPA: hypothetical protein VJJ80_01640 [Patescibacteria group bacterium]|nr:hypothetical protein [Patescibacteria group bacterium]